MTWRREGSMTSRGALGRDYTQIQYRRNINFVLFLFVQPMYLPSKL